MYLTTDHAASSYGLPVLVQNRMAYGPADRLPSGQRAADWARENLKDDPLLSAFLSQASVTLRP